MRSSFAIPLPDTKLIPIQDEKTTQEPNSDWSFWFLSGHRLWVIVYMVLGILVLYIAESFLLPHGGAPQTTIERIWGWGSLLWISNIFYCTFGLIGMLKFSYPKDLNNVRPISTLVSLRIVSRGINTEILTNTIRRCQKEMVKAPLFPYIIEVVTDTKSIRIDPPNDDVQYIAVPKDYQTKNSSLYKARALHFATEHSSLPNNAWIVHLDEETQLTSSGIKGICAMIKEEEVSGKLRIGQGAILYHRQWRKYPYLTLADNIRTGTDLGQFHFQHRVGITIFGFHGSYFVVRNDIERSIGFDFGPKGSITEDAFWALIAMENGYRCRWIDGYLEEQSTQSVGDFVRQRRRWFQGLIKVIAHTPVKLRWRLLLGINVILWALAPFAQFYTIVHFFYGFNSEWWVRLLANYSFVTFNLIYIVGLKVNLDEYGIKKLWERLWWYCAQIVLFPTFNFLESLGTLAAVFRPAYGFHVVKK